MSRDRVTYCGIFAVAIAAAVLSFSSLTGLAAMAGITGAWAGFRLAWLLPIAVDAYAVTATRVWLTHDAAEHTVRYARANAIGAIGLSVAGNATFHGLRAAGIGSLGHASAGWVLVVAVSAVPPVMLGLVGHLHALVSTAAEELGGRSSPGLRGDRRRPPYRGSVDPGSGAVATVDGSRPTPATKDSRTITEKARPATDRATSRTGRSRSTGKTSTGSGPSGAEAAMREHWRTERAQGRTPSGAELDRIAGTKDYGRRIRRALLAEEKEAAGSSAPADRAAAAAEEPARSSESLTDPATGSESGPAAGGLGPRGLDQAGSRDAA